MRNNLSRIVREVRDGSAQIALGSGEISQGVSDLSQRTEAQASNLQEASASLDTLLKGTHDHAQVSQQASAIARSAFDSAATGGRSVEDLIVQIGTVSERSQRITEITSVIDSIAFQTNILALNAAVEAARAGEQGRGFAVVAQEVRVLAQRSAAAASEIKTLIVDAVNSVVQVTSMASSTGDSVKGIVAQVREVDALIGQLTHASSEQSLQLAQISEAIRHIDDMTQKNAALVEENAAAAMSLSHEATELDTLVASFKLQDANYLALTTA
jgi:methyl-accepting chemotaxis protein